MFQQHLRWFRDRVEGRLRGETFDPSEKPLGAPVNPQIAKLGTLLALDGDQLAFVCACACAAGDPLLHAPLVSIGGADARRGLSLATYAAVTGAGVAQLVPWLAANPPILRLRVLAAGIDGLLPGSTPYLASPRLVAWLDGSDAFDPLLAPIANVVELPAKLQQDAEHARAADRLAEAIADRAEALIVIVGPRGVGRSTLAALAASRSGRRVIALAGSRAIAAETHESLYALHREALLGDALPLVADADDLVPVEQRAGTLRMLARAIDDAPRTCIVTASDPAFELPVARPIVRLELLPPDAPVRVALWRDALGDAVVADGAVEELAMRYPLGPGTIRTAAALARRSANGTLGRAEIVAGVRASVAVRFGGLADRLDVTDRWDDVVLPAETRDQIEALVARVRFAFRVYEEWKFPRTTARGGGVAALFSGPPGTGKTLVAGLIARELDRDLFRVDLSRVVSKWVGETEKQLGALFDAAESSDALLLFDEADSLFAKRTEVKSSSDRYANLEVNYLLQRIETFRGVALLTTNLDTSIDTALRRRLAAHITFWPPDHDERAALWRRFATCNAPVAGKLAFADLATEYPDMTGANIRNACLAAAFLAAAEYGAITQDLLARAARSEYRAMGRVLGRK